MFFAFSVSGDETGPKHYPLQGETTSDPGSWARRTAAPGDVAHSGLQGPGQECAFGPVVPSATLWKLQAVSLLHWEWNAGPVH